MRCRNRVGFGLAVSLLVGVAAAQQVSIVNAGFENGTLGTLPPGWTATAGLMYVTDGLSTAGDPGSAYEGGRFVTATWQATAATSSPFPAAQSMQVHQDVDLAPWAALIDVGDRQLELGFAFNAADPNDVGAVRLDFFDAASTPVGTGAAFSTVSNATGARLWETTTLAAAVPVGARTARIGLAADRVGAGSARNVSFDAFSAVLGVYVPPPPADLVRGSLLLCNPNGGWCWYQDERAVVDRGRGRLLVGSVASYGGLGGQGEDGKVQVCEVDLRDRSRSIATLDDVESYGGGDDHNAPALLVKEDGDLLAFYAGHNNRDGVLDDRSYQRTLDVATGTWSPVAEWHWWSVIPSNAPGSGGTTYSNLFQLAAEDPDNDTNGRIYNIARTQQSPHFMYSDDNGGTWHYGGQLTERPSVLPSGSNYVNGYYKYWSNGVDRIDLIATEYHPRDFNTSIYHAYIRAGKMYDSQGNEIDPDIFDAATSFSSANVAATDDMTPVFVCDGVTHSRAWNTDVQSYPDGTVTALFKTRPVPYDPNASVAADDHRVWFARFDPATGQWTTAEIARAGGRLFASEQDYTGLGALDPRDPDRVYISTEVNPIDDSSTARHEIYAGVTANRGQSWTWTAVTSNSTCDNLRPIVPAWDGSHTALLWWRGQHTNSIVRDTAVVGVILSDEESVGPHRYVDADAANTTLASGAALTTTTGGSPGATDGMWHVRTGFANGGTVLTADEGTGEDVPVIKTSVAGLAGGVYDVFVCFWVDPGDWRVVAGLSATGLMVYRGQGAQGVDDTTYAVPVLTREGNRTLMQAYLGRVDLDVGQPLEAYVDDHSGSAQSRIWYDGIAFAPVGASAYGAGCGTPALRVSPDSAARPVVGQTARATVANAPTPLAAMTMGFSNTFWGPRPLPLELSLHGMPGCELLQSGEFFGLPMTPLGGASFAYELTIPNAPVLVGMHLYLQALAYAPGQNALGVVVSNGLDWWIADE